MSDIHEQSGHQYRIQIDRVHYAVHEHSLTGAQLRTLPDPDIGSDRDLFEVVPGQGDRKIAADQAVEMHDGLRFFTAPGQINPGR
jgi:Multiubiquitin